jgi:hypothetical protein
MPTLLITGLILMVLYICFVVFYIKKTGKDVELEKKGTHRPWR